MLEESSSAVKLFDLEKEFINHITIKESLEFSIRDGLSIETLYVPKHKATYAFAQHYFNETKMAPTATVLQVEFGLEAEEPQTSIDWIILKLRERYKKNQVQDLAFGIADRSEDPTQAIDFLQQSLVEIQRNTATGRYIWGAGSYPLFFEGLQDKIIRGHHVGLPVGFDIVDTFTGGLKKGYLAFLAARPKRQKTFFLLKAFIEQKRAGYKPILFTLENTEDEIWLRLSCMLSGYPWDLAHRGIFDDRAWKQLKTAWEEFDSLGEHWISRPPMDERTVPAMMLQADKLEADSVIISQFKYIQPVLQSYNRPDHQKYAEIVMDLKQAATTQGSERPLYVEAQFNREGESIEEFSDIGLGQLGLTDMMGQAADVVFALYQNKDMRAQQHTQFGIIEARNHDKHNWYVHSEFKNRTSIEMVH
jgi:replicative DNA helicase